MSLLLTLVLSTTDAEASTQKGVYYSLVMTTAAQRPKCQLRDEILCVGKLTFTPSSSSSSYLVGAHLVDFAPCEMRWGLSSSGSILNRFVEGQQGEAELLLSRRSSLVKWW